MTIACMATLTWPPFWATCHPPKLFPFVFKNNFLTPFSNDFLAYVIIIIIIIIIIFLKKRLQIIKSLIFRVLGSKNPFFNKIWPSFSFRRATFEFFVILKRFKINMNLNSIIPNNEIYGINSCKNQRALVGALHQRIFFKIKINLNELWHVMTFCTRFSDMWAMFMLFIVHWPYFCDSTLIVWC